MSVSRYWWPRVTTDVAVYSQGCARCQKTSSRFDKAAPDLHSIPVPTHPWKQIGIDLCSLPTTVEGYVGIVVAVDYFSKWVEAEPIKDKTAETVAGFLYRLVCRHGCAEVQINDQGREFVNRVCTVLHELTGVKQRVTSAYHPQSNGLTERNNRTIQTAMLRVLSDNQEQWVKVLPGVLFAYRTSVQKSTGYTPFYLLYGRQAKLPLECELVDCGEDEEGTAMMVIDDSTESEIAARLRAINHLRTAISKDASENIIKAQDRQKRDYAKKHAKKRPFVEGDDVLLWNLRRADRKGGRMKDPWLGPYKIGHVCDNGTYQLVNEEGTSLRQKAHGVNLKLFVKAKVLDKTVGAELSDTESSAEMSSDDDVTSQMADAGIIVTMNGDSEVFSFKPTTAVWRKRCCAQLALPSPLRLAARKNKDILGVPCKSNPMAKDGNCFFRTLSYELCGTAEQHLRIREAVVKFMSADSNTKLFSDHINNNVATYLADTRMNSDGVWATDVEIFATATLLQTPIYVYSDVNSDLRWYRFKPLISEDDACCNQNIYITNLHQHFERVLAVD